ncbi:hypothetical protein AB7M35_002307 [Amorphus suaedae]
MIRLTPNARTATLGAIALLASALAAHAQDADSASVVSALEALQADTWVTRSYTFADIGLTKPETLASLDASRLVYLPVPTGLDIKDAEVSIESRFFRADDRRTTFVVSVDGYPVAARAPTSAKGPLDLVIGVDAAARPTGFVELGLRWSVATEDYCSEARAIGDLISIDPSSRFQFRYDTAGITDLLTAWSALPSKPVVLVSGKSTPSEVYDAAWRIGVTLEHQGKSPTFRTLPDVGDDVDITDLEVPAALSGLPAFASLGGKGIHTIRDKAELGALLLLPTSPLAADLAIADPALQASIGDALDALAQQVSGADAQAAFQKLRDGAASFVHTDPGPTVSLATLANRPLMAIPPGGAGNAATLFGSFWRKLAESRSITVNAIDPNDTDRDSIPLVQLGGTRGTFNVLAQSDWTTVFDFSSVAAKGLLPSSVVIDVAAAPGASASSPVASVLLNDYLLGAARLPEDGSSTEITAAIPAYALAESNLLTVRVQRQPSSYNCSETPQAFPAEVLPTSRIVLGKPGRLEGFVAAVAGLAVNPRLIVPASYLADPEASLPLVVRGADSTGLSVQNTRFSAVDSPVAVDSSFLAFGNTVAGANSSVSVENGRLVVKRDGDVVIDAQPIDELVVAEAFDLEGQRGIQVRTLGTSLPTVSHSFRFGRDSVAIITPDGSILTPTAVRKADTVEDSGTVTEKAESLLLKAWEARVPIAAAVVILFVLMVLRAVFARRRAKKH